ncbi:MAG TPA: hypothetical protein VKC61_03210 [Pyrinomonadaceae bacterium]|nr:hypothetical protein [Pyrinomonadaceae bacterium]
MFCSRAVGILVNVISALILYIAGVTRKKLKRHLSGTKRSKVVRTPSRQAQTKYFAFRLINYLGFFFNATMLYKLLNNSSPPSRLEVMMIFMYASLTLLWFYRAFIQYRDYTVEDWE